MNIYCISLNHKYIFRLVIRHKTNQKKLHILSKNMERKSRAINYLLT